jgi:predicted ATPase
MTFPRGDRGPSGSMSIDWHLVGLPLVQARSTSDPVHVFQQWLGRMIILRPYPLHISGDSSGETLQPNTEVTNLAEWWTGLISHSPSAYARIDSILREVIPDLKDIKNPLIARNARSLSVQFGSGTANTSIPFEMLSDGEKCMVIWALTVASNEAYGPVLCFWDEPDNFLSLSEAGDFATDLRRAFQPGGQLIATSHNSESIRRFSDENTFVLHRRSRMEPTQVKALSSISFEGDLISALVRGDLVP